MILLRARITQTFPIKSYIVHNAEKYRGVTTILSYKNIQISYTILMLTVTSLLSQRPIRIVLVVNGAPFTNQPEGFPRYSGRLFRRSRKDFPEPPEKVSQASGKFWELISCVFECTFIETRFFAKIQKFLVKIILNMKYFLTSSLFPHFNNLLINK